MERKAQTGGLVGLLVFGIAGLVIGTIIAFIVVNTLLSANLLETGRTTNSVANESGYLNQTGYTLSGATSTPYVPGTFTISQILDSSDNSTIVAANYTVSSDGVLINTTSLTWASIYVTYTNTVKSSEEISATSLSGNFTSGIDNVSPKIATALLIAGVVLILSILLVLVTVWRKMDMGTGTQL